MPAFDVLLVLVFVLLGGYFSASEIALVNLREGQVRTLERRSRAGARVAALRADPNRFLSAVQVGVTLCGFFASAYGGATLAGALEAPLLRSGVPDGWADTLALVLVTLLVSYLSLVLGELVPKRLALQRSERVAVAVAPVLDRLAVLTRPVIWVLGVSTNAVGRLVGVRADAEEQGMTEEELHEAVSSHEALRPEERHLLADVMEASDRRVSEVMVPRTEVAFLDGRLSLSDAVADVLDRPYSRYPVTREGSPDDVLGVVHVRDLLTALHRGQGRVPLSEVARSVAVLPGTVPALAALHQLREARAHLALVIDEYGGTAGVVTLEDLLEELVGEIEDEFDEAPRQRGAAAAELEGLLHREEVADRTGVHVPDGPWNTLGGFLQAELVRTARIGDVVAVPGGRLVVTAMDGWRIDRVRFEPTPSDADGRPSGAADQRPEDRPASAADGRGDPAAPR